MRGTALTNAADAQEPGPYAEGGEFGPAETPAQELVPVAGLPATPLHIEVKNLVTREEGREREVRLLHEELTATKEELRALRAATETRLDERDRAYAALLARIQEIGDWVDAPAWKPASGEGSE